MLQCRSGLQLRRKFESDHVVRKQLLIMLLIAMAVTRAAAGLAAVRRSEGLRPCTEESAASNTALTEEREALGLRGGRSHAPAWAAADS